MHKPILILWTCKDRLEAEKIAEALLEERLIACASIMPGVLSLFHWEGKIERAEECKVFLKSDARHFEALREKIAMECSYEVPEILEIEIKRANPAYLDWLQNELH